MKSDQLDYEKLAQLLCGGNFDVAYAYPKPRRAIAERLGARQQGTWLSHLASVD